MDCFLTIQVIFERGHVSTRHISETCLYSIKHSSSDADQSRLVRPPSGWPEILPRGNGDRLLFQCVFAGSPPTLVPHATHSSRSSRRKRLPRPARHGESQASSQRVWLLSDAKSFSPGCATGHSRCTERLHALVDDQSCPRLPSALPESWACVAGAFQKFSHSTGRPSRDRPALCAAQSRSCRAGQQAVQRPWSNLRVPHLADAAPIPLPEEGTQWIDQPLVAHELTTLRTCVNRQHPSGNSSSPPHWDLDLPSVSEAALQNLSSLSPFPSPPSDPLYIPFPIPHSIQMQIMEIPLALFQLLVLSFFSRFPTFLAESIPYRFSNQYRGEVYLGKLSSHQPPLNPLLFL